MQECPPPGFAGMLADLAVLRERSPRSYWFLWQFSVKSPQIEVDPQYIVKINHQKHYMKLSDLEHLQHLYAETTSPGDAVDKLIAPEKLVSWAKQGRGDAIHLEEIND